MFIIFFEFYGAIADLSNKLNLKYILKFMLTYTEIRDQN